MSILLFLLLLLPDKEIMVYETNDKGKIGTMHLTAAKDSTGYRVVYEWEDRRLEVLFDTLDMSTLYVKKTVGDKVELEITKKDKFKVYFKGRRQSYGADKPIYDRHAIEYALRGFDYNKDFKTKIRFHVPEFMIVNADVAVVGEGEVTAAELGEFDCWKVELKPHVLFFKWRFYFWIEKEYPHRFIKYEDSSGKNSILLIEYEEIAPNPDD
ncbi:MAG TPA: hypothetical protein ENI34_08425 [candidate division WOR-3 bacterium]|uniref:Uncharacterized protein n=1 Tax=candidate division WOR-3 bacterium TaxID=2052148 RepID=A0A9C9EN43_UNCW3|nr:hypothetical protein [candidate division WOR-3 bacterium]